MLAGAYVKSPACLEHEGYSAGSYRDVSRVATVDEKLWSELFLLNAAHLTQEIDGLIRNLSACRDAVAAGRPSPVGGGSPSGPGDQGIAADAKGGGGG